MSSEADQKFVDVNGREVPERFADMYRRAMTGRSRKTAVRVNCLMCVGWNSAEVTRCTAKNCPLYPYRLGGGALKSDAEDASEGAEEHLERPQGVPVATDTP